MLGHPPRRSSLRGRPRPNPTSEPPAKPPPPQRLPSLHIRPDGEQVKAIRTDHPEQVVPIVLDAPSSWSAPSEIGYVLPGDADFMEMAEDEPSVGDFVSDIIDELYAEEHRQGVPLVSGHCQACDDDLEVAWRAAERMLRKFDCPHTVDLLEITTLGGGIEKVICADCGSDRTEIGRLMKNARPATWTAPGEPKPEATL